MSEAREIYSAPLTPRSGTATPKSGTVTPMTPPISAPPSQFHSPSLSRSPLLSFNENVEPINGLNNGTNNKTPKGSRPRTPVQFISPLASPLRRAITPLASPLRRAITPIASPIRKAISMTKLDPQDAWLPITESRNGNAFYAAFHTLCSGIGIQALVLPVAFTVLGWTWGIICLTLAFLWQLYTLYLLVQLHESTETGVRYSRYFTLCIAAFGEKAGKLMAMFPYMYLSAGTCVLLISIAGSTCKIFFQIVCGQDCTAKPLTLTEWYLVFTCAAVVLSQLPNMNSIAGVSLIGAITAVAYITIIWAVSVAKHALPGVSYEPVRSGSTIKNVFSVLNALGIIAFAFRGHNLILEIQATMPSSEKHPSRVPMWKGVQSAYVLIAMCLYPLAIGGFWAYGNKIPQDGGMLTALYQFHGRDTSQFILGLTSLFVIVNALSSFQIYGMPMFDDIESKYTMRKKKPCPWWLRALFRALCGFLCFFFAVAFPFVASFAGLIGGIALPLTLAYPCFIWIVLKKPKAYGPMWCLNWGLGVLGMVLSVLMIAAGIYVVIANGVEFHFFKPH
ncbi:lysine histidine transporter-like 8 [Chenopodium quinoa]|uniref:lysine histidine transporter-like 8 n=1 Tax=Chenopodium quinoa TaxID=63459 RepID=UPI000B77EC86|nr:lysine histidine transporter-like 8 [Chenopodium quinoa]